MSLQFIFGPSGVGKSSYLYRTINERAKAEPGRNFFIIVPDQFTMQTQKEMVLHSENGGILNIDVLSFGRLKHRICEEVGGVEYPVLDDTGKSLVLQKVAGSMREQLSVLGSFLNRQGYIHQVKSAISEFMQYGMTAEDVKTLADQTRKRGALAEKLKDLSILYGGFVDYINEGFVTTEGTLDVLCRNLEQSELIRDSVVVFDGFTGFTPIQNRVIGKLLGLCSEVCVTLTMGEGENPYLVTGQQKLFHLSSKTVESLERLAFEVGSDRKQDIFLTAATTSQVKDSLNNAELLTAQREGFGEKCRMISNPVTRFTEGSQLAFLEKHLFRYGTACMEEGEQQIHLFETTNPAAEVHHTGLYISELVRRENLAYRDIAVITSDLAGYAPYIETEFDKMGIPVFLDQTRGIVLNPMVEFVKSSLELFLRDFSYEAVFHYLRSGLAGMEAEDVDLLENYCLATGIRGESAYRRIFVRRGETDAEAEEQLVHINELRERLWKQVECLSGRRTAKAQDYVNMLYDFLVANDVQGKLDEYRKLFESRRETARAREYAQIYRLVMQLLEQIYHLLGEEEVTLQEFYDILEAGFGEIQVGTIPQDVDRVAVGDVERTRLKQIKVLFFLGINDGNIPRNASKGGILSDMDREFLLESGAELAPGPREQMFIQRLYLYLNMTKPSERLYLSYSVMDSQGKSIRPAYLVDMVRKLFPSVETEHPEHRGLLESIVTPVEGSSYLAAGLREYALSELSEEKRRELYTLYSVYGEEDAWRQKRDLLTEAAFKRYQESSLPKAVALALYGKELENSVSRLETFAACGYRHFLQYGLMLQERGEFHFENVDMGTLYHAVLEQFASGLKEDGETWFTFSREYAERRVKEVLEQCAASYGDMVLYSNARNVYAISRMERVLNRTVMMIREQLKRGSFQPESYEVSFRFTDQLSSVNLALSEEERMKLMGRIDRIDVATQEDTVYVKVVDYKSGNRHFNLAALYYGLQLQLVVYMNAALELEAQKHPDKTIVPAAMLYYHVDDPVVECETELEKEELDREILKLLRQNGVVNSNEAVIERLDAGFEGKSDVIPVERKKDGSFSAKSSVMTSEQMETVSEYVTDKVSEIGRRILGGEIGLNPYELGQENACAYCSFRRVCGFDEAAGVGTRRVLPEMKDEEIFQRMQEEHQKNRESGDKEEIPE